VTEPIQPRHIPHAELELLAEKVTQDGGETSMLRHTAVHENRRAASEFEDGTRRE
jgi:hypothetical protein